MHRSRGVIRHGDNRVVGKRRSATNGEKTTKQLAKQKGTAGRNLEGIPRAAVSEEATEVAESTEKQ